MYLEEIRKIIFEKIGIELEEVEPASHFAEDLNIGESEFAEILEKIGENFQVDLSKHKGKIETIGELINILSEELD